MKKIFELIAAMSLLLLPLVVISPITLNKNYGPNYSIPLSLFLTLNFLYWFIKFEDESPTFNN